MSDQPPAGPEPVPGSLETQRLKPGPNADGFDPRQHTWTGTTWWTKDAEFFWDGVEWQHRTTGLRPGPARPRRSRRRNRLDFWIGFTAWFLANVVWEFVTISTIDSGNGFILALAWLPANVFGLIVLVIVNRWASLGALVAFACAFASTVFEGIVNGPSDFLIPSTPVNNQYVAIWFVLLAIGTAMIWWTYTGKDEDRPA